MCRKLLSRSHSLPTLHQNFENFVRVLKLFPCVELALNEVVACQIKTPQPLVLAQSFQKVDEPKWSQSTCVRYVQFLQSLTFLEVTGEQRKCMFSKLEIHQTQ